MRFAPEPPHRHGQPLRTGLLLVNLGTPEAPTPAALRRYLAEFLTDPRVVEIPAPVWRLILHGVVLRTRPAASAAKYRSIWREGSSPLLLETQAQVRGVAERLAARGHHLEVQAAMRYGEPALPRVLDALRARGCSRILLLPLYPQYAAATTASVADALGAWSRRQRWLPELRMAGSYHDEPGYIAALAASVREHWARAGRGEHLLMSFHGLPRRSLELGDPYHCQCQATGRLLAQALALPREAWSLSFQSRLGRAQWLSPYTEPTARALAQRGIRHLDVVCPGFAADNLETLEEVAMEVKQAFIDAGGRRFEAIACLNDRNDHLEFLTMLAERHLQGWPTRQEAPSAALQAQAERAKAMGAVR